MLKWLRSSKESVLLDLKMGTQTAEANTDAGIAAANQIVDFIKNGNDRFRVNK